MPQKGEDKFLAMLSAEKQRILRFSYIYAHSPEDREDLFQEIIFQLWKSWPSFKGDSAVSSWIYKIALRVAIRFSTRTRKRHQPQVALDGIHQTFITREESSTDVEQQELQQHLRKCISTLNDLERLIVALYLDDLPYRDISEILGISENLVAVKMKRLKLKLSNCIKERTDEE